VNPGEKTAYTDGVVLIFWKSFFYRFFAAAVVAPLNRQTKTQHL
jgi:hypothetical protein